MFSIEFSTERGDRVKMLTNLSTRLSTIRKDSWHYRLTRYGCGELADVVKRACPYWALLVPLSFIAGSVRLLATVGFHLACYLGYYPWIAFWWLMGFRPNYWRGLSSRLHVLGGDEYMFRHRRVPRYDEPVMDNRRWMMPLTCFSVILTVIAVWALGVGQTQLHQLGDTRWYYLPLLAYAAIIAAILLGNGWKHGPARLIKHVYFAVCPELVIVEEVPETSTPSSPGALPSPY